MKNENDNNKYQAAFFVVPSYILDLPDITLAYVRVYETIFQFWNKRLTCFLSNKSISERTGVDERSVRRALEYFEKHNELRRETRKYKRYLVQPERIIEVDCSENELGGSSCPGGRVQLSGGGGSSCPPEVKNINKESKDINIYGNDKNLNTKTSSADSGSDIEDFNKKLKSLIPVEYQETYFPITEPIGLNPLDVPNPLFEEFWNLYPSKINKKRTKALWETSGMNSKFEEIMDKLKLQVEKDFKWKSGFAPNPCNYLSDERWNDEITLKQNKGGSQPLNHNTRDWATKFNRKLI